MWSMRGSRYGYGDGDGGGVDAVKVGSAGRSLSHFRRVVRGLHEGGTGFRALIIV